MGFLWPMVDFLGSCFLTASVGDMASAASTFGPSLDRSVPLRLLWKGGERKNSVDYNCRESDT